MLLSLHNIKKTYGTKTGVTFRALKDVSLDFDDSGLVFIVGKSGSGKSTLLNIIGGLDKPDCGSIVIGDKNVTELTATETDSYRNTVIGFVFQDFNLITSMNVRDNVKLALDLQSKRDDGAVDKALDIVGLADKKDSRVLNLSGGQKQRIAIARALVKSPQILLADEPTGALDSKTGVEVMEIFKTLAQDKLVVVVTHDMEKALEYGDRIIEIRDGSVYRDIERASGESVVEKANAFITPELLKIESGESVTNEQLGAINETLSQNGKSYVFVESDPLKIRALYPQADEAVKQEKNIGGFVPYTPKDGASGGVDFIKSKLPFGKKIKLGLGNLNLKKVKMILTVILSVFTFVLFAVAISFNFYDVPYSVAQTVKNDGHRTFAIMRDGGSGSLGVISDADISDLRSANKQTEFYEQSSLGFAIDYKTYNGFTSFDGLYEIDDITKFGYTVIAGEASPRNFNSVLISQYAANKLIENGAVSADSVAGVVGKNVTLNGENFTVGGVFASKTEYTESEQAQYENDKRIFLDKLFVARGFVDDYINRIAVFDSGFSVHIAYTNTKTQGYYGAKQNVSFGTASEKLYDGDDYYISTGGIDNGSAEISSLNDIIISSGVLENGFGIYRQSDELPTINEVNADATRELTLYYNDLPVYVTREFKIKGVLRGGGFGTRGIIMSDAILDEIFDNAVYTRMLVGLVGNDDATDALVQSVYEMGLTPQAVYVEQYSDVLAFLSTFKTVILVISILMSLVILFLLYSFIGSSITLTRKNIGILRALGAKKADTFTIYALEGFTVTLISLILSTVLLLIAGPVVNSIVAGLYGTYLSVLNIKWYVYLITAALAIAVTAVSIALPIRKYNNISPIEAINAKD